MAYVWGRLGRRTLTTYQRESCQAELVQLKYCRRETSLESETGRITSQARHCVCVRDQMQNEGWNKCFLVLVVSIQRCRHINLREAFWDDGWTSLRNILSCKPSLWGGILGSDLKHAFPPNSLSFLFTWKLFPESFDCWCFTLFLHKLLFLSLQPKM